MCDGPHVISNQGAETKEPQSKQASKANQMRRFGSSEKPCFNM